MPSDLNWTDPDRFSGSAMLTLNLRNIGEQEFEVLALEIDGVTARAEVSDPEPVTIEPGTWGEFIQAGLEVDCDVPPAEDLRMRVRSATGSEQVATVETLPRASLGFLWQGCGTNGQPVLTDADSVTTDGRLRSACRAWPSWSGWSNDSAPHDHQRLVA